MVNRDSYGLPSTWCYLALAPVTILWAMTLLLVSPGGAFPLNDDWIYATAVRDWMAEGVYRGHPFATATFVGQAAWGRLFCAFTGFSFEALRWSTLVLWLLSAWAVALSALHVRVRPAAAALAGCLVIANPLAMNLGYTFMTDVPFLAALALAGYCYLRALETPSTGWLFAGSLFGAWGFLIRQFAVLLPIAFVLAALPLALRMGPRRTVQFGAALGLPWAFAWLLGQLLPSYAAALGHTWDPGVLGRSNSERVLGGLKFYGVAMVYLSLFAGPLLIAPMVRWLTLADGGRKRRTIGWLAAAVIMSLLVCWTPPHRIPYLGNLLYDSGVGPMTLKGIFMGTFLWRPVTLGGWWWLPTLLGLLGAAWMLAGTTRWLVRIPGDGRRPITDPRRRQHAFLMLWAVLMTVALYHPWLPVRFDRYFLGALAPVLLLAVQAPGVRHRSITAVQWAGLGILYVFSVLGVQDYMAWNTARWDTAHRLMENGVPPEAIDAGYEFNGWYTSSQFIEKDGPRAFLHSGELGWWAVGDTYALSWLPRPGFDKIEEISYNSWLAGEAGKLWLLRKEDE